MLSRNMGAFSWRLVIWFRFLVLRSWFFLFYKWFPVFHPANKLMFPRSTSDLVHVVVLVINGNLPKSCLKEVNAGLKKTAKAWFLIYDQYNVRSFSPDFFCWFLRHPILRLRTNKMFSNIDNFFLNNSLIILFLNCK